MPLPDPPPSWGHDEISKVLDAARSNQYATFANLPGEIGRPVDIDLSYRKVIDGLNHAKDWFAGFFVLRAHSNFLAGCSLCWSGHIPECYAMLRSCLENALYGLYLARNPNSRETWLRRHDSDADKKKVRDEFKIRTMLDLAKSIDKQEGEIAEVLYDRTIDYGAHPNERALMQMLHITEKNADNVEFKTVYLEGNSEALRLALKTTAQVGVCTLSLFRSIYRERFDILGVTRALGHMKRGL
jgi:hypothetical protein